MPQADQSAFQTIPRTHVDKTAARFTQDEWLDIGTYNVSYKAIESGKNPQGFCNLRQDQDRRRTMYFEGVPEILI